jgi:hypothetical protein
MSYYFYAPLPATLTDADVEVALHDLLADLWNGAVVAQPDGRGWWRLHHPYATSARLLFLPATASDPAQLSWPLSPDPMVSDWLTHFVAEALSQRLGATGYRGEDEDVLSPLDFRQRFPSYTAWHKDRLLPYLSAGLVFRLLAKLLSSPPPRVRKVFG